MLHEIGREPTPEELAENWDAAGEGPQGAEDRERADLAGNADWRRRGFSHLGDFIEDKNALLPVDAAIQSNLRETTTRVLASLTPREERVLRMRFGIGMNTDHTLEEVGQQFSVTRERIRQIEAKALRKLKHPSRAGSCAASWIRKRLVEIGDQVVGILDPDGQAHHVVGAAPAASCCSGRELPVRGGGGVDDQRARVAEIGHMAEDLETIDKFYAGLVAALDRKVNSAPAPRGRSSRPGRCRARRAARHRSRLDARIVLSHVAIFTAFSTCFSIRSDSVSIPISV
jgi:RNA polymerase sigma factor (sigma-70 family)